MRRFKVKVNDEVFEVEVEEVGRPSAAPRPVIQAPPPQPVQAPVFVPKPQAAPPPVQKPAQPQPQPQAAAPAPVPSGNGEPVKAPIPGVISSIKVAAGTQVKKGSILLILEAMKMQNEILAPYDATVASVNISEGASVQTNDVLLTLRR